MLAKKLSKDKHLKQALSRMENRDVSSDEIEGRIIAEILRNVDKDTHDKNRGVADWNMRSIVGCKSLKCSSKNNDPEYANSQFNNQFIDKNLNSYLNGYDYLPLGLTKNELSEKNIKENPVSIGILGASLIAGGIATGGKSMPLGVKALSMGISGGANTIAQYINTGEINATDVAIASTTGFFAPTTGFTGQQLVLLETYCLV